MPRLSLSLYEWASLQQSHRCQSAQDPGKLGDRRHLGLAEKARFARIETAGKEIDGDAANVFAQISGVVHGRQGMKIGNEIEGLAAVLQLDGRLHHAEVIAEMQSARRLNA